MLTAIEVDLSTLPHSSTADACFRSCHLIATFSDPVLAVKVAPVRHNLHRRSKHSGPWLCVQTAAVTVFGSIQKSLGAYTLLPILSVENARRDDQHTIRDRGHRYYLTPSQIIDVVFHPTKVDCEALTIDADGNIGLFKCNFVDLAMNS